MANVIVNDTNLTNIANAIRAKNGTQTTYLPSEMATAISNIPSGGTAVVPDGFYNSVTLIKGVTATNGTTTVYGYSSGAQSVQTFHTTQPRNATMYYASSSLTSSDIGENIFSGNRLVSYTVPSTDPSLGNYHTGGPFLYYSDSVLSMYFYFRYNTVSYTENDSSLTNTKVVTINYEGTITGVFDTWANLITALNNKTIDSSKGIGILGTTHTNTGQSSTVPSYNSVVYSS